MTTRHYRIVGTIYVVTDQGDRPATVSDVFPDGEDEVDLDLVSVGIDPDSSEGAALFDITPR